MSEPDLESLADCYFKPGTAAFQYCVRALREATAPIAAERDEARAACAVKDSELRRLARTPTMLHKKDSSYPTCPECRARVFGPAQTMQHAADCRLAAALSDDCGRELLAERDRLLAESKRLVDAIEVADPQDGYACSHGYAPVTPSGMDELLSERDRLRGELDSVKQDRDRMITGWGDENDELMAVLRPVKDWDAGPDLSLVEIVRAVVSDLREVVGTRDAALAASAALREQVARSQESSRYWNRRFGETCDQLIALREQVAGLRGALNGGPGAQPGALKFNLRLMAERLRNNYSPGPSNLTLAGVADQYAAIIDAALAASEPASVAASGEFGPPVASQDSRPAGHSAPPPMLPTQEQHPNGLHQRYRVSKADGTPCDPQAMYFVLRIDPHGDDHGHVVACQRAARTYCENAPPHMRQVAADLTMLLDTYSEAMAEFERGDYQELDEVVAELVAALPAAAVGEEPNPQRQVVTAAATWSQPTGSTAFIVENAALKAQLAAAQARIAKLERERDELRAKLNARREGDSDGCCSE